MEGGLTENVGKAQQQQQQQQAASSKQSAATVETDRYAPACVG
jgi:hypothetical protein